MLVLLLQVKGSWERTAASAENYNSFALGRHPRSTIAGFFLRRIRPFLPPISALDLLRSAARIHFDIGGIWTVVEASAAREIYSMVRNANELPIIEGTVAPEFHEVRREFKRNFTELGEQGAACAIYHRGQKVVDLWGGQRCWSNSLPWTEHTLSLVFSASKGMAAAAMAVAHSRGLFELDAPVADYWPEFQQCGKRQITVRQLLAHQGGLIAIDRPIGVRELADHDALAEILARQRPAWPAGMKHGYHTLTLGWYQSELIRRIDPQRRSLGAFFRDEVAAPVAGGILHWPAKNHRRRTAGANRRDTIVWRCCGISANCRSAWFCPESGRNRWWLVPSIRCD